MNRTRLLKLCLAVCSAALTYGAAEIVVTVAAAIPRAADSCWLFENSQNTVHFDAVRGYALTGTPSRWARVTKGRVEFVGTLKGNSLGFPDRDDFSAARGARDERRVAVFGDSFTAGQFLDVNWPDRAERLAGDRGVPLRLLNMAVDGGGLANWWSVLTQLVAPQRFDLDGVVFAVFEDDLLRKFSFSEHRGYARHMFARTASWDPRTYPHTQAEAQPLLEELPGRIVTHAEMEAALSGACPAEIPGRTPAPSRMFARVEPSSRWRPVLAGRIWDLAHAALERPPGTPAAPLNPQNPDRQRLIDDVAEYLRARRLPSVVVYIPSRDSLLASEPAPRFLPVVEKFARQIGARFVDGRQVFTTLGPDDIRASFFPYDGHWNQRGSDRFAAFVLDAVLQMTGPVPAPSARSAGVTTASMQSAGLPAR